MIDQLGLYNGALMICGESELNSLTENREARRLLDNVWNGTSGNGRAIRYCLERGQWTFAMRASRFDYSTQVTPAFGYSRAFDKPTDWVATSSLCTDEFFTQPLLQYEDEVSFWFADVDQIYVRYVSDDASFGSNMAKWPDAFIEVVKSHLARRISPKLPGAPDKIKYAEAVYRDAMKVAKNHNLMSEPARFPPPGQWNLSRHRGGSSRRDRGNRGSLIG